jgi:hypothetical protein
MIGIMSPDELAARLTRATRASPDEDGMILVPPELITETVEMLSELLDGMLMILPDDIELYRMLRKAGRKDAEKAAALAAHFLPARERLTDMRDNLPSDPAY